jgi:hypothetical protein
MAFHEAIEAKIVAFNTTTLIACSIQASEAEAVIATQVSRCTTHAHSAARAASGHPPPSSVMTRAASLRSASRAQDKE